MYKKGVPQSWSALKLLSLAYRCQTDPGTVPPSSQVRKLRLREIGRGVAGGGWFSGS
jgi:hypothetical protein